MKLRILLLLCVFCASVVNAFSLDREAFTFTNYDVNVRVEPDQQRLGIRGKISLRNDSATPQKIAVLQISSSLDWRSIKAGDKQLQFISQPYTSDIDHTGALTEAIVTLPSAISPRQSIDLEIAYEGVIVLDATRLIRIDTPEDAARSSDWDQISPKFTAVRGAGNVTWYPIATEAADLAEGSAFFDTVHRWRMREFRSSLRLHVALAMQASEVPQILFGESRCPVQTYEQMGANLIAEAECPLQQLNTSTLVIANFDTLDRPSIAVHFLPGHDTAATTYADAAEKVAPLVAEWFGPPHAKPQTVDLNNADDAPFETGSLFLVPLPGIDPKLAGLTAAHQLTHAAFSSPRSWINEGLAHFAQALYMERQSGRAAAIDYLKSHRCALSADQKNEVESHPNDSAQSLVNAGDEQLVRSKALSVWWMLRDMLGDRALKKAIASYRPEQDKEPSYMPRLIQAQTQKDLEWFFDDWVYRDRGLPDFKIDSVFPRKTLPEGYVVTVTASNQGLAGAEVPVTVKFDGGEVTQRLVVHGKSSSVIRIPVTKAPEEVVVNDGSVPESDVKNNTFKVVLDDSAK
jgi:hypothetical protein